MRVALVGLGGAARRGHLPALMHLATQSQITLAAICDQDRNRLTAAAAQLPGVEPFWTASSLLTTVQPDLVIIATDPAAHLDLIQLAFTHGCDVLCEKPIALDHTDYAQLRQWQTQWPHRALVPVHQYRHAPGWKWITSFAETLHDQPFDLTARVERPGTDPHAHTPWRNHPGSGGGLADHGVHYLALAYNLRGTITADTASRTVHHGREHVRARVLLGTGALNLTVNYSAHQRRTTVELRANHQCVEWTNDQLRWTDTSGLVRRRTLPALSNRRHVDQLYLPLYQDLLTHIRTPNWRDARWREVIHVGNALADLGSLADNQRNAVPRVKPRPTPAV